MAQANQNLRGRVVLITGAGMGIGRSLAIAFARAGARLALNDLTPINLQTTLEQVKAQGAEGESFLADVAKKMAAQTMVEAVMDRFGAIDVLINHANVSPSAALLELDEWDWDRTLAVNLKGPFLLTQSVGRLMKDRGGGVILNLWRAEGPDWAGAGHAATAASKAGLRGFTQAAAEALRTYNIHVIGVVSRRAGRPSEAEFARVAAAVLDLCAHPPAYPQGVVDLAEG